jgi:small-conductance mechanosensitive channel
MNQSSASQTDVGGIGLIDAVQLETGLVAVGALLLLLLARLVLGWLNRNRRVSAFFRHALLVGLTMAAVGAIALTLKDPVRDQVLKFLGIVFSAVLALSSTTLVGNGLAGVMLRAQSHFRGGDWLSVGDLFGQITRRGLFFTTVQNELRDLVTLPNVYLATRPVTVVSEPTYISTKVSLGYDVPRVEVERLLVEAAKSVGLEKAYVYVLELGDFSILYRVSGKLMRTDELLTMKSNLRSRVLDTLHAAGVEIVSPTFMNQRAVAADRQFIPEVTVASAAERLRGPAPEADTFDKGRQAKTIEQLDDAMRLAEERMAELRRELDECESEERREVLRRDLDKLERGRKRVAGDIEEKQAEADAAQ